MGENRPVLMQQETDAFACQLDIQRFADDTINEQVGRDDAKHTFAFLDQGRKRNDQLVAAGVFVGLGDNDLIRAGAHGALIPRPCRGVPVGRKVGLSFGKY